MTSSPEVCLTDEQSRWSNGNQTGVYFYLEWTGHSWRVHYVNDPVLRGLSWMVATLDHWCDWITLLIITGTQKQDHHFQESKQCDLPRIYHLDSSNQDVTYHFNPKSRDLPYTIPDPVTYHFNPKSHDLSFPIPDPVTYQ